MAKETMETPEDETAGNEGEELQDMQGVEIAVEDEEANEVEQIFYAGGKEIGVPVSVLQ